VAYTVRECERCLAHEGIPGVRIDEGGTCSICKSFDREWGNWPERKEGRRRALEQMFADCRKKNRPYDVLVPLSGGKDSTYVLYLCRKEFDLRCLAVTWDQGFLTDHARRNIERTVEVLGVDHIFYGISKPLLMQLYRSFFLKTGFFCPVCMRGIAVATEMAAAAFKVPLVVTGTSRRTEEYVSPEFFMAGQIGFFRNVLAGDPLLQAARQLLYTGDWKRKVAYHLFWWTGIERVFHSAAINMPDYLDWDYDRIFATIQNELGWMSHRPDEEHSDCSVDNIVDYVRQCKFPALQPELLRYSKLATAGLLRKEDARDKLRANGRGDAAPANLDGFCRSLGITEAEFREAMKNPLRHMRYRPQPSRAWNMLRVLKRALLNPVLRRLR